MSGATKPLSVNWAAPPGRQRSMLYVSFAYKIAHPQHPPVSGFGCLLVDGDLPQSVEDYEDLRDMAIDDVIVSAPDLAAVAREPREHVGVTLISWQRLG